MYQNIVEYPNKSLLFMMYIIMNHLLNKVKLVTNNIKLMIIIIIMIFSQTNK